MPIYAYKCESCGHTKDVLQKISDEPLNSCPQCGIDSFRKQVTAAGFQLKGSGWYVTDFRGGSAAPAAGESAGAQSTDATPAATTASPDGAAAAPASAPAPVPAPAPAPAVSSEAKGQ